MKKNTESIFFQTIGLIAILIIVIGGYSLYTDKQNKKDDNDSGMNKSPIIEKINVIGTYKVKKDKNSKLIIKEHGEYELSINLCSGYLTINGRYEQIDKSLRLINDMNNEEYENLNNNREISFTIVDENTIRLDEDLECLHQKTLFEK